MRKTVTITQVDNGFIIEEIGGETEDVSMQAFVIEEWDTDPLRAGEAMLATVNSIFHMPYVVGRRAS